MPDQHIFLAIIALVMYGCAFQVFNSKFYNKIAVFPTILLSGIYHEYVLWAPMRYVMPVLLLQFGMFGGKY